jgi:hypothetical protein
MAFQILNALLTDSFQPSAPVEMVGNHAVIDSLITVANTLVPGTRAQVQWYLEFCSTDPNAAGTVWYRETSEEDIGNGNVRMNKVVRRWAEYGSDLDLDEGTHQLSAQFERKHNYYRVQIRKTTASAETVRATLLAVIGKRPISPA